MTDHGWWANSAKGTVAHHIVGDPPHPACNRVVVQRDAYWWPDGPRWPLHRRREALRVLTPSETWHAALRRADTLDPDRISRAILERTDTGLRATTYDRDGGRTTHAPCIDEWCPDGPDAHSHPVTADPTGNAAMHGAPAYNFVEDLRRPRPRVANVLTGRVKCGHNVYMEATTATATFPQYIAALGFAQDELSTDAENVLRRAFEAGTSAAIDTFRGLDGRVYIRWAA